jgi:hypothetical protein
MIYICIIIEDNREEISKHTLIQKQINIRIRAHFALLIILYIIEIRKLRAVYGTGKLIKLYKV